MGWLLRKNYMLRENCILRVFCSQLRSQTRKGFKTSDQGDFATCGNSRAAC